MSNRFDYVKYDEPAVKLQHSAKTIVLMLEHFIDVSLSKGRPQSLALTALEEVYMWIGKGIRDDQVQKRRAEPQEERSNE